MAPLSRAVLDELQSFTTPSLANAIETFHARGRNEGFMDSSIECMFPALGPVIGFAATARIRAAEKSDQLPPTDFFDHVLAMPEPRVVVVQDLDFPAGVGSFWGEVNANVFRALGAIATITNGAVRDLSEMEALGFQAFAGSVGVSHAYVHLVEVGQPVDVGGITIRPGELLHGDRHGVVSIPPDLATELPGATRRVEAAERELISLCQSSEFSIEALVELAMRQSAGRDAEVRH